MNMFRVSIFLFFAFVCVAARADDVYFGGSGDTKTHWVGYRVTVSSNSITWTAYTLDLARHGKIKIAPATFSPAGTNRWTATFDEYVFRTNAVVAGLASHNLQIISTRDRQSIQIQDGKEILNLLRMSPEDLRAIKSGRIPNKAA